MAAADLGRRVGIGSRQRGLGECDPALQVREPGRRSPITNPEPVELWECPQSVLDVAGMPPGWLISSVALEPSASCFEELLAMRRASKIKWKFGHTVDEVAIGTADSTPGSSSMWTVMAAVTREENEIWSIATEKRDPKTGYSQWKVAVNRDGTVAATKIGDFSGGRGHLVSWTSDGTRVPEINNRTAELFTQLLATFPNLVREAVPNWVVARTAALARQNAAAALK